MTDDPFLKRAAVAALGLTVLISLIGAIVLTFSSERPIPDIIIAIGSGALGGLTGILVPSGR